VSEKVGLGATLKYEKYSSPPRSWVSHTRKHRHTSKLVRNLFGLLDKRPWNLV